MRQHGSNESEPTTVNEKTVNETFAMSLQSRAPRQWCLSKTENITLFENWKCNRRYSFSFNFSPFRAVNATWLKLSGNALLIVLLWLPHLHKDVPRHRKLRAFGNGRVQKKSFQRRIRSCSICVASKRKVTSHFVSHCPYFPEEDQPAPDDISAVVQAKTLDQSCDADRVSVMGSPFLQEGRRWGKKKESPYHGLYNKVRGYENVPLVVSQRSRIREREDKKEERKFIPWLISQGSRTRRQESIFIGIALLQIVPICMAQNLIGDISEFDR